jgi:hypothetical protein
MSDEMGYQCKLYIGTAGAAAATQVTNATDVDYDLAPEKGSTTVRGTSGRVPIKTENVTLLSPTITWKMLNDPVDANLVLMISAAIGGAALAIKVTTGSGAVLFDGDCTLSKKYNAGMAGESTYDFTATPTKSAGRGPTLG